MSITIVENFSHLFFLRIAEYSWLIPVFHHICYKILQSLTIKTNVLNFTANVDPVWSMVRLVISVLLVVLAVIIAIDSVKALAKQAKTK